MKEDLLQTINAYRELSSKTDFDFDGNQEKEIFSYLVSTTYKVYRECLRTNEWEW